MNRCIPLFFATEDDCFFTQVAVHSILEHGGRNSVFQFHVLVPEDFPDTLERKLEKSVASFAVTRISTFKNAWQKMDRVRNSTYYRLLIADMFPQYDRTIYLDSDIIVQGDLAELYAFELGDDFVAGTPAPWYILESQREEYARSLGIPNMEKYINAGVLLLNTKKIREHGLSGVMAELTTQKFNSQDQDILNKVLFDGIRHLPFRFNVMTKYASWPEARFQGLFSDEEMREAWASPLVIHYADKIKPWDDPLSPYAQIWWHEAAKCDNFDEILLWAELRRKKRLTSPKHLPPAPPASEKSGATRASWRLFHIPLLRKHVKKGGSCISYYLFHILPLWKIQRGDRTSRHYLFHVLYVLKNRTEN